MSPLSRRESECLRLAALGLTADLAARRLSISERTVRDYLRSGRLKLRAENTTHAVAVAITNGLIQI
ncbi:MAG: helix-turn-helix domain-containing protein [Anaerolineae bacterium]|nr:helix-turn-helix domain-containing protein [Anaerolineae bacterium]